MRNLLLCALSTFALPAALAAAQTTPPGKEPGAPARKTGAIFRGEVDRLIGALRNAARSGEHAASLGGDSALATAQILCAMGHCHRFYHVSDGPVVRPSLQALIRARNADGSFGSGETAAATTAWVVDALQVMDADGFGDEIRTANAWLGPRAQTLRGFDGMVDEVLAKVDVRTFPEHFGEAAAASATRALGTPASLDVRQCAADLALLVACQVANRKLDAGQDPQRPHDAAAQKTFSPAQQKAFGFLMGQQKDGVFSASFGGKSFPDPAFTAFGLLALQTKPAASRTKEEQATIEQGLRWLLQQQNAEDGSFGQQVQNYTTSVVIGALTKWGDPAAKPVVEKAQKFILACQNVESTGYQKSDRDYGSIGYGGSQRGDLSNLNFALQALRESGLPANDEAFAKALVFLQRTQNLKKVNDFSGKVPDPDQDGKVIDSTSGDDGGAAYYPGNSAAGYVVQPDGKMVPRSYGSMTYALLKAYMLCGLKADDPRVQAAVQWIQNNWTLAMNPGFEAVPGKANEYAGLFYYYMMLAQALDLVGIDTVATPGEDGKPKQVAWRKALREHLEGMQQPDGAWKNTKNQRWMEGSEVLCTCYAMVALETCR